MTQDKIRNIAIIAHVDHGKTTLVDQMLKQGGVYRENQAVVDRVMDSGDLERERGITILAKNTAVHYKDYKINIVDTPGHADFSGEVERILKMVDGVLLLVDAAEGPMPQTRFVLQKALELGHKVIVVVNKIDRPDARVHEVMDEVLELLLDLNATEEQFDSPTIFCSAREGTSSYGPDDKGTDLIPLFETIVNYIDPPKGDENGPLQVLVSSIDYNEFVGRMGIGRIERGTIHQNEEVIVCDYHDPSVKKKEKVVALYEFTGLGRSPIQQASAGEIVAFSGISDITIGRTLCDLSCHQAAILSVTILNCSSETAKSHLFQFLKWCALFFHFQIFACHIIAKNTDRMSRTSACYTAVDVFCFKNTVLIIFMDHRFLRCCKNSSHLDSSGSQHKCCCHTSAVCNSARCDHRDIHCIDNLRNQYHCSKLSDMSSGLCIACFYLFFCSH